MTDRRTQAERSAVTQRALLDATIECVAELGYAGASTTEIVKRAGVSRGAQVHHYPTKIELVVAALNDLFDHRTELFVERLEAIAPEDRTVDTAIGLLWDLFGGPSYRAGISLVAASLSDPQLKPVMADALRRFDDIVTERYAELFPEAAGRPFGATALMFAFCVIEGAALYREVGLEDKAEEI